MKKVGIMTWYKYQNYGTALQAVALFHMIEQLGYEPYLIQYTPKDSVIDRIPIDFHFFKQKIREKLYNQKYRACSCKQKDQLFSNFLNCNVQETEPCNTYPELQELNTQFDAFVCGSDQIWSPLCFDEKYFLPFVEDTNKIVAYAPSVGSTHIENTAISEHMTVLISRFEHLSVREGQGAELISQLCNKNAQVVLDPTLLLNKNEWNLFAKQSLKSTYVLPENYILCYFLGEYERYGTTVHKIAKALNLPVYVIPAFQSQEKRKDTVPFEVGPAEFVRLVQNARYICTDSFHGMAFAINFNIPFTVFKRFRDTDPKNQNSRIMSLLNMMGLQGRLIDEKTAAISRQWLDCNFIEANDVLKKQRQSSLNYLRESLKKASDSAKKPYGEKKFKITDFCCGCGACASICPRNAITIQQDQDGFAHYTLNSDQCILCKKCRQVCPYVHVSASSLRNAEKLYSFKSTHDQVLKTSSSGGAAYEIADLLNKQGYWVCGSAYNRGTDCAEHLLIPPYQPEKLVGLQGSKYLQSKSAKAFAGIASLPKETRIVFFGTPCQAAGLDKILRVQKRRDSAVLVDLICHGVPTQLLWERYLNDVEKHYDLQKHPAVVFRSDRSRWNDLTIKITDSKNTYLQNERKDVFYAFFRHGLCYLKACYECPYREKSAADIRIGDYWGPRFQHDHEGVSMVIANSLNGIDIINQLSIIGNASFQEFALEEYWSVQFPYNRPRPLFYDDLLKDLKDPNKSLSAIRAEYCSAFELREKMGRMKHAVKTRLGR